jgi:hypothetical protein
MSSAEISNSLSGIAAASGALATLRLWRTGLYRRYRALASFLIFVSLAECLTFLLLRNPHPRLFLMLWYVQQPLTWFFSVWIVLELYCLILEKHKGLTTLGRWVQYAGFSVATLISLLAMLPRLQGNINHFGPITETSYLAMERAVNCGMLVFLVVILIWISRYPVPLSRNLLIHAATFSLLFLSNSIGFFSQLLFGYRTTTPIDLALTAIFAACVLSWLLFLNRKGEEVRIMLVRFSPEQEERILRHLEALNKTMLKVSRN